MASFTETTIRTDGHRFRVLRGGKGTPLLFLHGAAGASWLKFHDFLAERHEVYVTEHPGFGGSPHLPGVENVTALAEHYCSVLTSLNLDSAHVVGSSFGGWLASELAILVPARFKSLTLIGPAGMFPRAGKVATTAEEFTRSLYFDQSIADKILELKVSEEELMLRKTNRAAVAQYGGEAFHNPLLRETLQRLSIPSFILWGEHDRLVPSEHAMYWAESLRAKSTLVMNECGHLPHVERPRATADWILSHVEEYDDIAAV